MNALTFVRDFLARDEKPTGERRTFRHGWVSYYDSLSAQQQKTVVSYTGDDTVGSTQAEPLPAKSQV